MRQYDGHNNPNYKADKFDWNKIQQEHDEGLIWSKIPERFGFSEGLLKRAETKGLIKNRKHKKRLSEKEKANISEIMKKLHAKGKHPGWNHINSDKDRRSYPEKMFYKNLKDYGLLALYTIKEKFPQGKYFLDFAIIDLKIDIEIDGEQHFRNKEAINHDKERDEFMHNKGWLIYRIAWSELQKDYKKIMEELINYLNNKDKKDRYYLIDDVKNPPKRKYGTKKEYLSAIRKENYEKEKENIQIVLNSNIDFSKRGWTLFVSELIGKKRNKVSEWIKKYLPEIYENANVPRKPIKVFCKICGTNIRRDGIHQLCKKCYNIHRRKNKRPSYEQLMKEIQEYDYVTVGKKYGVTDNTIRKWKRFYEKNSDA